MKNFSSDLPPPTHRDPNPHTQQEEREGKEEEDKGGGERARCEWNITLSTVVSSSSAVAGAAVSDTLGVVESDASDTLLATGGIARKIRVYSWKTLVPHESHSIEGGDNGGITFLDHNNACDYYICTPAKLSSLRWRPDSAGRVLGSGDYDGVVTEYDLERRVPVFERDEHGGRRVWSIAYSHWDSVLGASGSDDGTLQMWDPRCEEGSCVAEVQPSLGRSPVCCVEFSPIGGAMVTVGCADRRAYGYDVRRMGEPVMVLEGHRRTVTYVRFLEQQAMVTSATDGCLKLWDVGTQRELRTYEGHVNGRSFVGLSVWRKGGLLGCGSESNQVFVYDKRWGEPIWVHDGFGGGGSGFVSGLCWRQAGEEECALVAGGSDGVLQVFLAKRMS